MSQELLYRTKSRSSPRAVSGQKHGAQIQLRRMWKILRDALLSEDAYKRTPFRLQTGQELVLRTVWQAIPTQKVSRVTHVQSQLGEECEKTHERSCYTSAFNTLFLFFFQFECDICHRKYKSSDILRHHVRMVHKNLPRVTCDICQKEVSRVSLKAHLNRHKEKQEEEEESARHLLSLAADSNAPSCRVCTKYFENEKLLEMHACEGRDGGTSYPCQHCNESFPTASELVAHNCEGLDNSKSRNTAKIYKCIFCNREYNCHTVNLNSSGK